MYIQQACHKEHIILTDVLGWKAHVFRSVLLSEGLLVKRLGRGGCVDVWEYTRDSCLICAFLSERKKLSIWMFYNYSPAGVFAFSSFNENILQFIFLDIKTDNTKISITT